jgi:hypothetical protein
MLVVEVAALLFKERLLALAVLEVALMELRQTIMGTLQVQTLVVELVDQVVAAQILVLLVAPAS